MFLLLFVHNASPIHFCYFVRAQSFFTNKFSIQNNSNANSFLADFVFVFCFSIDSFRRDWLKNKWQSVDDWEKDVDLLEGCWPQLTYPFYDGLEGIGLLDPLDVSQIGIGYWPNRWYLNYRYIARERAAGLAKGTQSLLRAVHPIICVVVY